MKTFLTVLVIVLTTSSSFADQQKSNITARKPAAQAGGQINIRIGTTDTYLNAYPIVSINPTLTMKGLWISGDTGPSKEGPVECLVTPELAAASNVDLVALAKEILSNERAHFECMRAAGDIKATWFKVDY